MLDVGCSVGATLEAARVFNWQAVGVDVSQDAVEYCQERDLNAVKVASGHLPFDDASFDLVVNWHVIEHVSDVRQTLDEWYRVLKPGGILFLETPDGASPKVRRLGKHYRKFWAPEHTYTFTYSNLAQFMCSTGFEVIPGPAVGNPFQQGLTFAPYLIADRGFKGLRKLLGVHKEFQIFGRKPAAESLLRQPTLPVAA